MALFILLGIKTVDNNSPCPSRKPSGRCLAQSVNALDQPLLWMLPLGAGIAGAAAVRNLRLARNEPPLRAVDVTWEDFNAPRPK